MPDGKSKKEIREEILKYEKIVDGMLADGKMNQEDAWDGYFGLLHECDCQEFWDDRERILAKIDTEKYNPLASKNPEVVYLARLRLRSFRADNN
ncbi:MAG: hypothetical protein AAB851_02295 [Patescibacteria group bacterium]